MKFKQLAFWLFVILLVADVYSHCGSSRTHAQVRLVDPTARPKNTYKLVESYKRFNEAAQAFNDKWGQYKTCWDIKPEKLLPDIQKMRDQLNQAESLLLHIDEVEP